MSNQISRELDSLNGEDGTSLLLHQAGFVSSPEPSVLVNEEQHTAALHLVRTLDAQPLALHQAGAYIRETGCSIEDYHQLYHKQVAERASSEKAALDHTPSAITGDLSFAYLAKAHPLAAEILRVCTLLAPAEIPLALFQHEALTVSQPLPETTQEQDTLEQAIGVLETFYLLADQPSAQTFRVSHPLQLTVANILSLEQQQDMTRKLLCMLARMITSSASTEQVQPLLLLPHIQHLATFSQSWTLSFPEAAHVFSWAADILSSQEDYSGVELLLKRTIDIYKCTGSSTNPLVATTCCKLATLYKKQKEYEQAEDLFMQANLIRVRVLGPEHPDTILSLCQLGSTYAAQGRATQAETIYSRALENSEQILGPEHPITVTVLDHIATLYLEWSDDGDAGMHHPIKTEAPSPNINSLWNRIRGTSDLETAQVLHKLALIYIRQEKWEQAEASYQRVLQVYESLLGNEYAETLECMEQLALLYMQQQKFDQAEALLRHTFEIKEHMLGIDSPDVAGTMNLLASVYLAQGKFEQAEQWSQRTIDAWKNTAGDTSTFVAMSMSQLAATYVQEGRFEQAQPLLKQILTMQEQLLDADDPEAIPVRQLYQQLQSLLQK